MKARSDIMTASRDNISKRVASYALLTSVALILSYVEAMLPSMGLFKLGLANIAVTLAVYAVSIKCGGFVMLCRVMANALLFGSATSFLFSLFGGILAFAVSSALKPIYRRQKISLIGISVLAAASHNIGQVIAACLVLGSTAPLAMLWWLMLGSIITGTLTGIPAQLILHRFGGIKEK